MKRVIRFLMIAEVEVDGPVTPECAFAEAAGRLDAFRDAVEPYANWSISLCRGAGLEDLAGCYDGLGRVLGPDGQPVAG